MQHTADIEFRKMFYMSGRLGGVARERAGMEPAKEKQHRGLSLALSFQAHIS